MKKQKESTHNPKKTEDMEALTRKVELLSKEIISLKEDQKGFFFFLENTPDFIYVKDKDYQFQLASNAFAKFAQYDNWKEIVGKTDFDLFSNEYALKHLEADKMVVNKGTPLTNYEELFCNKNDEVRWVLSSKIPVYDKDQKLTKIIGIGKDITLRKQYEEKIKYIAKHDSLTGLPSRLLFEELANQQLKASRSNAILYLLFIDLNKFKEVNDTFGHLAGDIVLKKTARRLKESLRESDILSRFAGDEFIALLCPGEEDINLEVIKERILKKVSAPIRLSSSRIIEVSCSIGVSIYPDDSKRLKKLILDADRAMYSDKENSKKSVFV